MKTIFALLIAAICAVTAHAQTIKSLGYNTTNDTVVATQRITFPLLGVASGTAATPSLTYVSGTNLFGTFAATSLGVGPYLGFSVDGVRRFYISTNDIQFELPVSFNNTTNAANTRTNMSLGAAWLTNTDVTNFRAAIGLGATNEVLFGRTLASRFESTTFYVAVGSNGIEFEEPSVAATTRTNLGIPLAALTNTSNVTMMRELAGSTNTNEPFSGVIQYADHPEGDAYNMTFSNGILLKKEGPL